MKQTKSCEKSTFEDVCDYAYCKMWSRGQPGEMYPNTATWEPDTMRDCQMLTRAKGDEMRPEILCRNEIGHGAAALGVVRAVVCACDKRRQRYVRASSVTDERVMTAQRRSRHSDETHDQATVGAGPPQPV